MEGAGGVMLFGRVSAHVRALSHGFTECSGIAPYSPGYLAHSSASQRLGGKCCCYSLNLPSTVGDTPHPSKDLPPAEYCNVS